MPSLAQALLLDQTRFTRSQARTIARRETGHPTLKGALIRGSTAQYWHIRLQDPHRLRQHGFTRVRVKRVKPGVKLIIAAKGAQKR